jgi:hypothetical protein
MKTNTYQPKVDNTTTPPKSTIQNTILWPNVEVWVGEEKIEGIIGLTFTEEVKTLHPLKRCRQCQYSYKHQYGKMYYCSQKKSNRTAYGHARIKMNSLACGLFRRR